MLASVKQLAFSPLVCTLPNSSHNKKGERGEKGKRRVPLADQNFVKHLNQQQEHAFVSPYPVPRTDSKRASCVSFDPHCLRVDQAMFQVPGSQPQETVFLDNLDEHPSDEPRDCFAFRKLDLTLSQ